MTDDETRFDGGVSYLLMWKANLLSGVCYSLDMVQGEQFMFKGFDYEPSGPVISGIQIFLCTRAITINMIIKATENVTHVMIAMIAQPWDIWKP